MSTALLTDRYELTMIEAALADGLANRPCVFELFTRRLPGARRFGVVAGTGRLLELLEAFRFEDAELAYLASERIVDDATLGWLADFRFRGSIRGYREGELFFPGSPVLVVEAGFAEGVLLETLALSVLNHDSAVATAAARMVIAADGRPLAEMGSRRTGERSAVASSRAAWIAGFAASSNLEAGRSWEVPTMGTAAHAFTLLHDSEEEAFRAQLTALGIGTTLLVDTYDIREGIDTAIRVAGTSLGGIRIDSGDLAQTVAAARAQLDSLGATATRITVTNDLDEHAIAALRAAPVDAEGVGTSVVTGSGSPAAGMVYKLVSRQNDDGDWVPVGKRSAGKATVGGRKQPSRMLVGGTAVEETIRVAHGDAALAEARPDAPAADASDARELLVDLVRDGEVLTEWLGAAGTLAAREHHAAVMAELPTQARALSRGEPAIPTVYR